MSMKEGIISHYTGTVGPPGDCFRQTSTHGHTIFLHVTASLSQNGCHNSKYWSCYHSDNQMKKARGGGHDKELAY